MNRRGQSRDFERSARVAKLMREILAGELETIDDERLDSASITGIDVDNELEKAVVFFDSGDPEEAEQALVEYSGRLRHAVSSQARLRRTPRLEFKHDEAVEGGGRIEDILAGLHIPPPDPPEGTES